MKRKYITKLVLLMGAALLSSYFGYSLISTSTKDEMVTDGIEENQVKEDSLDLIGEDNISIPLLNSAITDSDEFVVESTNEDAYLSSGLFVQHGVNSLGKDCIRYVVCVPHLEIDVIFKRTLTLDNGNVSNKTITADKAYKKLQVSSTTVTADSYNVDLNADGKKDTDYNYFVCYTMSAITDPYATLAVSVTVNDNKETDSLYTNMGTHTGYNISNVAGLKNDPLSYYTLSDKKVTVDDIEYTLEDTDEFSVTKYSGSQTEVAILDAIPLKTKDHVISNVHVTKVAKSVFSNQDSITSITLPKYLTSIGSYAFQSTSITEITLPDSLIFIGERAFGNTKLTSVVIPDAVTTIEQYAFCDSPIESMYVGASVNSLGAVFVSNKTLATLKVSDKNTTFDSRDDCNAVIETLHNRLLFTSLNTVIPDSVKIIAEWAYYRSVVTTIHIPKGVSSIETGAFYEMKNITSITVDEDNRFYNSSNDCNAIIYTNTHNLVLGCGNTTVLSSVLTIDKKAFFYCKNITNLVVAEGVEEIHDYAFQESSISTLTLPKTLTSLGNMIFNRATNLKTITYTGTKAQWEAISKSSSLFTGSSVTSIVCSDGTITL